MVIGAGLSVYFVALGLSEHRSHRNRSTLAASGSPTDATQLVARVISRQDERKNVLFPAALSFAAWADHEMPRRVQKTAVADQACPGVAFGVKNPAKIWAKRPNFTVKDDHQRVGNLNLPALRRAFGERADLERRWRILIPATPIVCASSTIKD